MAGTRLPLLGVNDINVSQGPRYTVGPYLPGGDAPVDPSTGEALTGFANPDVKQMLLTLGLRLMQPRPAWQTKAGQLSTGVNEALTVLAAQKAAEEDLRMKRAEEQRKKQDTESQIQYRDSETRKNRLAAEKAERDAKGEDSAHNRRLAREALQNEETWAKVERERATTEREQAYTRAINEGRGPGRGPSSGSGGAKKTVQSQNVQKETLEDGRTQIIRSLLIDGTPFTQVVTSPMKPDVARAVAEKEFEHIKPGWFKMSKPEDKQAYEDNVKKRVQQLTQWQTLWLDSDGKPTQKDPMIVTPEEQMIRDEEALRIREAELERDPENKGLQRDVAQMRAKVEAARKGAPTPRTSERNLSVTTPEGGGDRPVVAGEFKRDSTGVPRPVGQAAPKAAPAPVAAAPSGPLGMNPQRLGGLAAQAGGNTGVPGAQVINRVGNAVGSMFQGGGAIDHNTPEIVLRTLAGRGVAAAQAELQRRAAAMAATLGDPTGGLGGVLNAGQ